MVALLLALAAWPHGGMAAEPAPSCRGCPPMVTVPAGRFVMGDDEGFSESERPAVPVTVPRPFALGRTEVTFDEWRVCVAEGACRGGQDDHGWGRGRRPVINITWEDAATFAAWVGRKTGRTCRLPTEAEWEYAARAGTGSAYWWGDKPGRGRANCRDCLPHEPYGSLPAGSLPANPWGLSDMNGNVWEWTRDCWTPSHSDPAPPDGASCTARVIKGGSWYYFHPMARAAARARNDERIWSYNIGFRVLCEL